MESKPTVFLCQPRANPYALWGAAWSMGQGTAGACRVAYHPCQTSLLTLNFNSAWCVCLNERKAHGFTHFAMLHSDVVPLPLGEPWIDTMLALMEEHDADVLSAVVPIKNKLGLTSTAIDEQPKRPWLVRRLTMHEIFDNYDPTFTHPDLLVNTGLWICRLDDWCEKIRFRQQDSIGRNKEGRFIPITIPEDWDFSRQVHAAGKRLFATRDLAVMHEHEDYHTREPWGEWERDEEYFQAVGEMSGLTGEHQPAPAV